MNTIYENVEIKNEIKKSKFISIIFKTENENDFLISLNNYKKEYKNATHYCFAYVIDQKEKYSDDKEPQGTAGIPILKVIKDNNLNNVAILIIRYFGGIKFGAALLLRTYLKLASEVLKSANVIKYEKTYHYAIKLKFENENIIRNNKNIKIIKYYKNEYANFEIKITDDKLLDEYQNIILNKQKI